MRIRTRSALALLALAGLLPGCGRDAATSPTSPDRSGGTLVVGLAAEPDSLNVYLARGVEASWIANRVLPRLARERLPTDARPGGFEPEAAASWDFEDGGRTLVVRLRPGVTCEDLRFTLRAQTAPEVAWRGAAIKRHIAGIDCPDARTARVRFAKVYPGQFMDLNDINVLPAALARIPFAAWRATDWSKELPAAGPFRIAAQRPGQEVVLERHAPAGAPGAPRLDRVVLRVVPDAAARTTQLLAGDLDLVPGLTPEDAARVAAAPGLRLERRPDWGYTYLGWNTRARDGKGPHPVLGDARVRRALTLAIDRRALVDVLLKGEGEVPSSPLLAPLPEHDATLAPWPVDRAAARRLLDEAGWRERDGGGRFALELLVQAGSAIKRNAAQMVQQDLAQVGVRVDVVPVENSAFYRTLGERRMDAWIGGWRASARVDTSEILHGAACSSEGNNFGCFSDPEADRLAERARDEMDEAARISGWRAWERVFHAQQPYTMLYRTTLLTGVSRRVHGTGTLTSSDALEGVETWSVDPEEGAPAQSSPR